MRRRVHLLAFLAAMGVLLHAATAAAAIWCAMGGLTVSCCCPSVEVQDHDLLAGVGEACCRDAVKAPDFDAAAHAPAPAPALPLIPWDEPFHPGEAVAHPAWDTPAQATSPPLLALATIVIVR